MAGLNWNWLGWSARKVAAGLPSVLLAFAGTAAGTDDTLTRIEMPLADHAFERRTFKEGDMPYLMGNGEMGGLADLDGLGFEKLWFADLWESPTARRSLQGPRLVPLFDTDLSAAAFQNRLDIETGILTTEIHLSDTRAYKSSIFFSKTNKDLLVISVRNLSTRADLSWQLQVPDEGFEIVRQQHRIAGTENTPGFTPVAWALGGDVPLDVQQHFTLQPGKTATFLFSVTTPGVSPDHKSLALANVLPGADIETLLAQQRQAWRQHWRGLASVILPEGAYARWFYRSLYTLYATAGSDRFLPGELQFSVPDVDWQMHPFTYGYAGWGALAFMAMGDEKHARRMLDWHYKPEALHDNVGILFGVGPSNIVYNGDPRGRHTYMETPNPEAIAFGHELTTDGHNIIYPGSKHWDKQRSLDGFAAAMFHRYSQLYPDSAYLTSVTYPVLKGTAELWRSLTRWDEDKGAYILPPLLSVAENIMEPSVLDAVLAARWNLSMAAQYADRLGVDQTLAPQWRHLSHQLLVPEDGATYLEYLGDTGQRAGGGYFGIRAAMYLGYPLLEQIPTLDREKVFRTLDLTWERNNRGNGMITFVTNWFALTEAYWGRANRAFETANLFTKTLDRSGVAACEAKDVRGGVERCLNPYFLTGYASFILTPLSMMLQSHDGELHIFPAMPKAWPDAAFYDLPATGGYRVSAKMKGGQLVCVTASKDGQPVDLPFTSGKPGLGQRSTN